jgi:hypothetical protein
MQMAGELPQAIDIGMELVLGELGTVVRVVDVDDDDTTVWVDGEGQQERSIFGIAKDGSMPYRRALQLELAVDWDSGWETADFFGCADATAEARADTPEEAVRGFFERKQLVLDPMSIEQSCPVVVRAYRVDDMAVVVSNFFLGGSPTTRSPLQRIIDFTTAFAAVGVAHGNIDASAAAQEAEELTAKLLSRTRRLVSERSYWAEDVERILRSRVAALAAPPRDTTSVNLAV